MMRPVWTQWVAKFERHDEEIRVDFRPWNAKYDDPPGMPDDKPSYLLHGLGPSLLERFMDVQDYRTLLRYLRNFGLPHVSLEVPKTGMSHVEPAPPLLEAAATLRWLVMLLNCMKEGKLLEIKPLCELKPLSRSPKGTNRLYVLEPRRENTFRFWNGVKKLGSCTENAGLLQLKLACSDTEFRQGTWVIRPEQVEAYLVSAINYLVKGISPRLGFRFRTVFGATTPYEAMCLALFGLACNAQPERPCARSKCQRFVYLTPSGEGQRRQRSDTKYCSDACKQSVYDAKVRKTKKVKTAPTKTKRGK